MTVQNVLAVGHPGRSATRAALLWCVAYSVGVHRATVLATLDKPLRAHSPWQDDPYDVMV